MCVFCFMWTSTLYFFNSHNIKSKYNYLVFNLSIFLLTSHQCSNRKYVPTENIQVDSGDNREVSTSALSVFNNPSIVPCRIRNQCHNCSQFDIHISSSHIFREGNGCTDKFANMGHSIHATVWWDSHPGPHRESFFRDSFSQPDFRLPYLYFLLCFLFLIFSLLCFSVGFDLVPPHVYIFPIFCYIYYE